jgi:hypothetical protein
VVAADAHGVPARDLAPAEGQDVGDDFERGAGREYVGAPGDVFLEDVVLDCSLERGPGNFAFFGQGQIHGQEDGGRGVDGHGHADLVQGDAPEEELQVAEGAYGHSHPADFAPGPGMVGIQADLGGQVEGDAQAGLSLRKQIAVAAVRFLGGPEPGVLPHGP